MWTRGELSEIKSRAEQEANVSGISLSWKHACLTLASAVDRFDAMTARIESGDEKAVSS